MKDEASCFSLRQVYTFNYESELDAMFACLADFADNFGAIVGFDGRFREMFCCDSAWCLPRHDAYTMMRLNLCNVQPREVGIAISNGDGSTKIAWNFNVSVGENKLSNDMRWTDAEEVKSCIDLSRFEHDFAVRARGLDPGGCVQWVMFSGMYDLVYLNHLLSGTALPENVLEFDAQVTAFCRNHDEIRSYFSVGSLADLAAEHGVGGVPDDVEAKAGFDALLVLRLFVDVLCLQDPEDDMEGFVAR
eukprot:TRINITY_DN25107_c0_g1_i1.p1 TRINITY_DN25107_c0_g1~~TRINITY_DN25107_c0_g1_i1.p1  ORF type:complete len:247 (+),score=46.02 TRINITY_DN25107_c0_g1_i1:75-815(+)